VLWWDLPSKYNEGLGLLNLGRLNGNDALFVRVRCLTGLRDQLIHHKPLWDSPRPDVQDLVALLRQTDFTQSRYVGPGDDFIAMQCMSASCAQWAVRAASDLILEYGRRTGMSAETRAAFSI
jgi:hypothetical protein